MLTEKQKSDADRLRVAIGATINEEPEATWALAALAGPVYTTAEMTEAFEVHGFLAPFVVVTRKSDGVKGSLMFTHYPRKYFLFEAA